LGDGVAAAEDVSAEAGSEGATDWGEGSTFVGVGSGTGACIRAGGLGGSSNFSTMVSRAAGSG
jgi:hypothetical protein